MKEKMLIEVFGIPNMTPPKSGCSCGPELTMEEMYTEFMEHIKATDIYDKADIQFLDMDKIDVTHHPYAKSALEAGFKLPLVAFNQRVRFHHSIPFNQIYRLIKQQLKKQGE